MEYKICPSCGTVFAENKCEAICGYCGDFGLTTKDELLSLLKKMHDYRKERKENLGHNKLVE